MFFENSRAGRVFSRKRHNGLRENSLSITFPVYRKMDLGKSVLENIHEILVEFFGKESYFLLITLAQESVISQALVFFFYEPF